MTEIDPKELATWMEEDAPRNFRLVDVRENDEYDICHIPNAELIPLSQFAELAVRKLGDKSETLVMYCHHGMRSQRAAEWLRHQGYENVINMVGGIHEWAEQVAPEMPRY